MQEKIEKKVCKNCIHYQLCVHLFRKAKQLNLTVPFEEGAFFADASDCDYYEDNRIYHKQEWISVEERLPENKGNIITYHGNFQEIDAYYYCGNGGWMDGRGDFASSEYYGITHWMPMPEPPKGE